MPRPIKNHANFEVLHYIKYKGKTNNEHMPSMEAVTGHYEIGLTVSGDRRVFSPNGEWEMHSGYVGTAPLNLPHQSFSISNLIYDGILVKYSFEVADIIKDSIGIAEFHKFYKKIVHVLPADDRKIILSYFEQMLYEFNHPSRFMDLKLTNILSLIIIHIIENEISDKSQKAAVSHSNLCINQAMRYIEKNYNQTITLNSIAKYYNFSPAHFSRPFKACTGDTFSEYLNNVRFEKAVSLLSTTNKNINEIAQLCGFNSTNYFCDAFKRRYLKSPLHYRKDMAEQSNLL